MPARDTFGPTLIQALRLLDTTPGLTARDAAAYFNIPVITIYKARERLRAAKERCCPTCRRRFTPGVTTALEQIRRTRVLNARSREARRRAYYQRTGQPPPPEI